MMLSLIIGIMMGVCFVLLRRFLRRGIRGAQEIEKLGLPVFGTINYSAEAAKPAREEECAAIIALTKPDDLVVEALRSLRTSLHFGMT